MVDDPLKSTCFWAWVQTNNKTISYLKSDSHVPENFCQITIIPSGVQKNTIICLFDS